MPGMQLNREPATLNELSKAENRRFPASMWGLVNVHATSVGLISPV